MTSDEMGNLQEDPRDRLIRQQIDNWQPRPMPDDYQPGPDDPRIPIDKRRKRPGRERPSIDPGLIKHRPQHRGPAQ